MKTAKFAASALLAATLVVALGCGRAPQERTVLVYAFDIPAGREAKPDIDKAVAAIDRRLNGPGWSWNKAAKVRRLSDTTLEVRLPTDDPGAVARIERLVSRLGSIEFRILANDRDNPRIIEKGIALKPDVNKLYSSQGKLEAWWLPVDPKSRKEFNYPEIARRTVAKKGQAELQILVLADPFNVTGAYLTHVAAGADQRGRPNVTFQFNSTGGRKFGGLTSTHLPDESTGFTRKLGIILDGCLFSAPSIRSTIHDRGEITGSFTRKDVDDMVAVLNAGALPAPLKKVSERAEKP
jgi:preprotein translocase subunit SecD